MKTQILFLIFSMTLFISFSYGQEENGKTYIFKNPELVSNISSYKKALSTADMTSYRFLNKSSILEFKSGLIVELFSANVLMKSGLKIDKSRVLKSSTNNDGYYFFDISSDGKYIMQIFTKTKIK